MNSSLGSVSKQGGGNRMEKGTLKEGGTSDLRRSPRELCALQLSETDGACL
jgi:hypothetical protein